MSELFRLPVQAVTPVIEYICNLEVFMDGFDVCAILCTSTIEISMYRMVYIEWGENGGQLPLST